MFVIIEKGSWGVQESWDAKAHGSGPDAIKAAVNTIVRQHPSIVGPETRVSVYEAEGAEPSVYPLSHFTGGGITASEPKSDADDATPLHQETGEAGA